MTYAVGLDFSAFHYRQHRKLHVKILEMKIFQGEISRCTIFDNYLPSLNPNPMHAVFTMQTKPIIGWYKSWLGTLNSPWYGDTVQEPGTLLSRYNVHVHVYVCSRKEKEVTGCFLCCSDIKCVAQFSLHPASVFSSLFYFGLFCTPDISSGYYIHVLWHICELSSWNDIYPERERESQTATVQCLLKHSYMKLYHHD